MRALKLTVLAFVLAGIAAALLYRNWVGAQSRAVVVLSTVIDTPLLSWGVKVITDEPRVEDTIVAGAPTLVVRPGGGKRWPAIVFVNGATREGRHHPDVQNLARGLARAGYLVLVPDLPGLPLGEIGDETVAATVAVARAASDRPDAREGRVGFIGVSVGTTLALLAAEDPHLAPRVSFVSGLAPYTDMRKIVRLVTTGSYPAGKSAIPFDADPYVALAVARSLAADLPPGRDRERLLSAFEAVDDEDPHPLAVVRERAWRGLGKPARALVALLSNRNPERFSGLYAALPAGLRAGIDSVSPLRGAQRLTAPVLLASAPKDKYFPVEESRALAAAATGTKVELTVTQAFSHVDPKPSPRSIGDFLRFDGYVVRVLERASL